MKLAYLSNTAWPSDESGLSFSINSARGFMEIGADCQVILRGRTLESVPSVLKKKFGVQDELPILPLRAPLIGGSREFFYLRAFLYLLKSDKEVVITRNLAFLPWACALRRLRGMRVWFEAHDFWTDPSLREDGARQSRRRHARLENKWMRKTDGILCVSEPLSTLYRRYYPDIPVVTAITGCKPPMLNARREFSYTLGYIGAFTLPKYPLPVVFEAFAKVADSRLRFLCVGARSEAERQAVEDAAVACGVAGQVEVRPWAIGRDLDSLKARIDVGVAVLSDGFLNRTTTSHKILEYLAGSLPFIASRLEGIEALVKHGTHGFLVDNTPEAWGRGIESIYASFVRYREMAEACYDLAARSGWDSRAKRILTAVGGIHGGSGAPSSPSEIDADARRGGSA